MKRPGGTSRTCRPDPARQRLQLLPGPHPDRTAAHQFGIWRGLGRRRRPRHLVGPARLDHATAPAPQDPGVRLYRARRHRVGAQRAGELRPDPEASSAMIPGCRTCSPASSWARTSSATTPRPAIVGKPGQTITVPIFVSHFSERSGIRSSCDGGSAATIRGRTSGRVVEPTSIPITWRPYDVVDLEPLKFTLPDYPFVGATQPDLAR